MVDGLNGFTKILFKPLGESCEGQSLPGKDYYIPSFERCFHCKGSSFVFVNFLGPLYEPVEIPFILFQNGYFLRHFTCFVYAAIERLANLFFFLSCKITYESQILALLK